MGDNSSLLENTFYHVYNRGNNGDNIFYEKRNYDYFLKKYDQYLSDYVETYAYCLLPNHFHLLIRVKPYVDFPAKVLSDAIPTRNSVIENEEDPFRAKRDGIADDIKAEERVIADSPEMKVSEQFRRMFIGYSQSINAQESRTGSLFQKPFKRKEVDKESYLTHLIHYIHANPQKHGICDDFRHYGHSSYARILTDRPSRLFKQSVIDWFGSKDRFIDFHKMQQMNMENEKWAIEEDY